MTEEQYKAVLKEQYKQRCLLLWSHIDGYLYKKYKEDCGEPFYISEENKFPDCDGCKYYLKEPGCCISDLFEGFTDGAYNTLADIVFEDEIAV